MQHPEPQDLTALAYGLIEDAERDRLLEHMAECDQCRAVYDSYRDEQTLVREAVVRDARSGPAEARALERTLVMLGAAESVEQQPAGKLLRVPLWMIATQVAALLVVAVGLFLILKPEPQVMRVAAADRAPATVEQGEVLVEHGGEWRKADALPAESWARVGAQPVSLALDDGSRVQFKEDSVFRLSWQEAQPPVLEVHAGYGKIMTAMLTQLVVRAGDANIHMMPGSTSDVTCSPVDSYWRENPRFAGSWNRVSSVHANFQAGEAWMRASTPEFAEAAFVAGDSFIWTPQTIRAQDSMGGEISVRYSTLFNQAQELELQVENLQARRSFLLAMLRFNEVKQRNPDMTVYSRALADLASDKHTYVVEWMEMPHSGLLLPEGVDLPAHGTYAVEGGPGIIYFYENSRFEAESPDALKEKVSDEAWAMFHDRYTWDAEKRKLTRKSIVKLTARASSSSGGGVSGVRAVAPQSKPDAGSSAGAHGK
jgi:hypothetical protein